MTDKPETSTMRADSANAEVHTRNAEGVTMRPSLGIRKAAEAAKVHEDTIRRAYKAGKFPNATKGRGGSVSIPVTDLEAAGYRLYAPTPAEQSPAPTQEKPPVADPTPAMLETIERLEKELQEAKAFNKKLLELMGEQLKVLGAGAESPKKASWWRRGRADSAGA